ncbi:AzlC family ABC transporter permease [Tropicimonas sp. IMCC34011]|uniref:AzlC family ABC transporter permease n=1 Tax=Tropicimonas sp. IMCC34011 TaxID=2248759 RepID=UPI000E232715|nr:AzlC family ABC transporter permease [Tropicimonas sp. IMCC34011]
MSLSKPQRSAFVDGLRAGAPHLLVIAPFGILFGVVATETGLPLAQVMGFTVFIVAGAAQFTALQLLNDGAPLLIIIATALAVNLRMAMYSAGLVPHFGSLPLRTRAVAAYLCIDQSFAASAYQYEQHPEMTAREKAAFFFGVALCLVPVWYGSTLAGALAGQGIPDSFALDFALPITFIALIAPALRTRPHVAAAVSAIVLSLLLRGLPYNTGLLVAGIAAMMVGAETERRLAPAERAS